MHPLITFHPLTALQVISRERCTTLLAVPTMLLAMLQHPDFETYDLSSLARVGTGGASVPVSLIEQVTERIGADVCNFFGQTEASPFITKTMPDDPFELKAATVGLPLPHSEVKLINPATGGVVPLGERGELCCRGYQVMAGYYQMPEQTHAAIDSERWLHTGDLAQRAETRVVLVSGEGRAFCSGLDTKELAHGKLTVEWFETWERGVTALAELDAITIAAIQGYCLGGGLQLALACDLRIASANAILSIPAVKEGVVAYVATVRLTRLIGAAAAKELCLLGRRFSAEEGVALRLITEVIPPTMLEERALALAQELLSIPFPALLYTKRQIDRAFGQDTEGFLNAMTAVYEDCLRSPEHATVKTELKGREKKT